MVKVLQNTWVIEKSLLTGHLDTKQPIPEDGSLQKLAKDVVDGDYERVLTSPYARELFKTTTSDISNNSFGTLFDFSLSSIESSLDRELLQLILAVACLHAFVQINWTGPGLTFKLSDIIVLPSEVSSSTSEQILDHKAISELAYGGEPAYHLTQHPTFLRLAQLLLDLPYPTCASVPWWKLRMSMIHEQILDEVVPLSSDLSSLLGPLSVQIESDLDLSGRLLLERGLLEHLYAHDKEAAEYFIGASKATGLKFELTGALGKRTRFQETDLSQLVLLAESRKDIPDGDGTSDSLQVTRSSDAAVPDTSDSRDTNVPETLPLNDDTLLERTEFTSYASGDPRTGVLLKHIDPSSQPPLHPLDQCILLSLCLNVKNTSPSHGLTNEQMSPYVARVISHPRNWSVHSMALLLQSRLEASRTRTVERSTLQLQALVDQMLTAESTVSERLLYFHSIPLPSKWDLERELALRLLSLGVVKSALQIFERLEMWEEVVKCWQSMERSDKAIAVVRDLLEGRKEESKTVTSRGKARSDDRRRSLDTAREAKLWCVLGDLEPKHALDHYNRAWEISNKTSGRAMRSLGGYYFARGQFSETIACLKKAVVINPLLARSWFILGCAYIRQEDWEGARDAFSRCVSIDEEDAESWNNLASMYLRLDSLGGRGDQHEESEDATIKAVPFSNKMLAFRALKQGLRYSYENWRMWSNYMIVAMDVGELSEACRAQGRIIEERCEKAGVECVDEEVIERLVDAVTRASVDLDGTSDGVEDIRRAAGNPNEGHGLLGRVLDLFERTIFPRVSSTRIYRAYARLLTWQSRWEEALAAYLNAFRCSTAGTMQKGETDVNKWREAVGEVEDIVDTLRNFGPRVDGYKWKLQARSILRTFAGRMKEFEEEAEWPRLSELQDELRSDD